jgi:RNA-directed DNA polymerase
LNGEPLHLEEEADGETSNLVVYTEGKTDWKHLKRAARELNANDNTELPNLSFNEIETDRGDADLLDKCRHMAESESNHEQAHVFLFDRDNPKRVEEVTEDDQLFRSWGNKVYSAVIPSPPHREDKNISIELYYTDDDLLKRDNDSRRIFLGHEFYEDSGKHLKEPKINTIKLNKTGQKNEIIDEYVYNEENESIALSKNDFSNYILDETTPFGDVDFSPFREIFDLLSEIEDRVDG